MAKKARPGSMRTPIRIQRRDDETGEWAGLFPAPIRCAWVNAHGSEAIQAAAMEIGEVATLTLRFYAAIDARCRVFRVGDDEPYKILSLDNVGQRDRWLEIKVTRDTRAEVHGWT